MSLAQALSLFLAIVTVFTLAFAVGPLLAVSALWGWTAVVLAVIWGLGGLGILIDALR